SPHGGGVFSDLGFRISFGIRISGFGIPLSIPPKTAKNHSCMPISLCHNPLSIVDATPFAR
ncbi:MAG: hypothetical protein WCO56_29180, partial [Verrucomicrobiota bacterium]